MCAWVRDDREDAWEVGERAPWDGMGPGSRHGVGEIGLLRSMPIAFPIGT